MLFQIIEHHKTQGKGLWGSELMCQVIEWKISRLNHLK
jgi:hypothetical protein